MSFTWIIIFLLMAIFSGTDRGLWGGWGWGGWGWGGWGWGGWGWGGYGWGGYNDYSGWWSRPHKPLESDFEVLHKYVKPADDVVVVNADDYIANPDDTLEKLIADGKLDEARKYRNDLVKIAEEMKDNETLRKYAIYGARIAREKKFINREKSAESQFLDSPDARGYKTRAVESTNENTHPIFHRKEPTPTESPAQNISYASTGSNGRKLEINTGTPVKKGEEAEAEKPVETDKEIDSGDYSDLISL